MASKLQTALRIFIGLILLATSIGKLLDNAGFAEVLKGYQLFPDNSFLLLAIGLGLSLFELLLAVLLLSNRRRIEAAFLALILHIAFTTVASRTLLIGLELPNCGCFGVFLQRPLTWGTVGEDVFMTIACAALLLLAQREYRNTSYRYVP
jgi:hypothetical protein